MTSHKDELDRLIPDPSSTNNDAVQSKTIIDTKLRIKQQFDKDARDMLHVLRSVASLRRQDEAAVEMISGYGEIWSTLLLQGYLLCHYRYESVLLNARDVLFVDYNPTAERTAVNWILSADTFAAWKQRHLTVPTCKTIIITGYIATQCGTLCPTTLKRNGSDFSGTIFGRLLNAVRVSIWTDVDGVYTCNPRQFADAVMLPYLSYDEACELANFGAKVVHPLTMGPAMDLNIPIIIRNTFNRSCSGTVIYKRAVTENTFSFNNPSDNVLGLKLLQPLTITSIRGFSVITDVALVTTQASLHSRYAFSSLAEVLFKALSDSNIKVLLATQSCNQLLFRFGVRKEDAALAKKSLERALFRDLFDGEVDTVSVTWNCALVAAVGDGVDSVPGISGVFFGALGQHGVNILLIGGSAERSVSAVIDAGDAIKALEALHQVFYPAGRRLNLTQRISSTAAIKK